VIRALLLCIAALAALNLAIGSQFEGDALAHYDIALKAAGAETVVLDTWTRPLPLLSCLPGHFLGIEKIFLVPAALTLASLLLVHGLVSRLFDRRVSALATTLFLLTQYPILQSSVVTFTEVPNTFFLSLALFLHFGRTGGMRLAAYLAAGCLPLCRSEGLVFAALLGAGFLWSDWQSRPRTGTGAFLVTRLVLAAAPFLAWMAAGMFISGDALWYYHQHTYHGVVQLRGGPLSWLLLCNGFTRLHQVVPPLLLPLFFCGAIALPGQLGTRRRDAWLLIAFIILVLGLLSLVVVSRNAASAFYAAAPLRLYAQMSPVVVIILAAGFDRLREHLDSPAGVWGFRLAFLIMLISWPLDLLESAGLQGVPRSLYLVSESSSASVGVLMDTLRRAALADPHTLRFGLLLALLLAALLAAKRAVGRRMVQGAQRFCAGTARALVATLLIGVVLVASYPNGFKRIGSPRQETLTRFQLLEQFGGWYRKAHPADPPEVAHQLVHSLDRFCKPDRLRGPRPRLDWRWDHELEPLRSEAEPGTLFLLGFSRGPPTQDPRTAPYLDREVFDLVPLVLEQDGVRWHVLLFKKRGP
jgi:hypothetical protein